MEKASSEMHVHADTPSNIKLCTNFWPHMDGVRHYESVNYQYVVQVQTLVVCLYCL